jgi:hypothetical protein
METTFPAPVDIRLSESQAHYSHLTKVGLAVFQEDGMTNIIPGISLAIFSETGS